MATIKVKEGEPIEYSIKRFKGLVERSNKLRDYAEHEFYEKPSEIKKRKKALAIKRRKRELQKEQDEMMQMHYGYTQNKTKKKKQKKVIDKIPTY